MSAFDRVVESACFFMYTGMVYDVFGNDPSTATQAQFIHPEFSFDMLELFLLADYLGVQDLIDVLRKNFITPKCLFSPASFDPCEAEEMVASMLARCSTLENPLLIQDLTSCYVRGTGGTFSACAIAVYDGQLPTKSISDDQTWMQTDIILVEC